MGQQQPQQLPEGMMGPGGSGGPMQKGLQQQGMQGQGMVGGQRMMDQQMGGISQQAQQQVQKNTAYGVFLQACWAQLHKRQYPDELIHKEIEEFNKQCSVWWYNLSEQERERFQEMADRSNAQQAALNQAYSRR